MFLYFDILTRSPTLNLESLLLISLSAFIYVLSLTSIGLIRLTKYHVVIIKKIHKFIFTTNPFIILKSATFRVNFTHYQSFISTI